MMIHPERRPTVEGWVYGGNPIPNTKAGAIKISTSIKRQGFDTRIRLIRGVYQVEFKTRSGLKARKTGKLPKFGLFGA